MPTASWHWRRACTLLLVLAGATCTVHTVHAAHAGGAADAGSATSATGASVPGRSSPNKGMSEPRVNAFNDPFFQIASAVAGCPLPAGPFVTPAERLAESHHRAERGTTCWLAGQCSKPNAYAYDAGIAQALQARLAQVNPFAAHTLWVTVQGRVVYVEGCVATANADAVAAAIERFVSAVPEVHRAVAIVYHLGTARPPYKLRSAP